MASPILEDDHLYSPLRDLRLDSGPSRNFGGENEAYFSLWLYPLKGVKAGPLLLMGQGLEARPLLCLSSGRHVSVQLPSDGHGTPGALLHSETRLPLLKWSHVAVEICCGRLRLLLDGHVEVDTLVGPNFFRSGPLVLTGATERNDDLIFVYNPRIEAKGARLMEEENLPSPVQLILSPHSENPKTASGTDILEFRPTTVDGTQVFAVVGGKPSCRRKFVITVELVDARGRCALRELDLVASLVFADSELPVPSGGNGAEAPLLTTFDGVEFPSDEKPTRLVNGKASFKFTISQLASKCENRLFSICFQAFPARADRPYLRLLSKPIHSVSRKRPHKGVKRPEAERSVWSDRSGPERAEPAPKRIRKDAPEDVSDSDDSGSSGTEIKQLQKPPSSIFKPAAVPSHAERPSSANTNVPAGMPRFPGPERPVNNVTSWFGHHFSNTGSLVRTRTWPGGVVQNNLGGLLPEKSPLEGGETGKVTFPLGAGETGKVSFPGKKGLRDPPQEGKTLTRKGLAVPSESNLTSGGRGLQGTLPPPVAKMSNFTMRVSSHAAVIREYGLLGGRERSEPLTSELRQRQAEEICLLRALLASRKVERALELVADERRIQGLEEQMVALSAELRASVQSLRRKRQQLMDEDAEIHDVLVNHFLPVTPNAPGQPQLATSATARVASQTAAPCLALSAPTSARNVALPSVPPVRFSWDLALPRPPFGNVAANRNDVSTAAAAAALACVAGGAVLGRRGPPEGINLPIRRPPEELTQPLLARLAEQPLGATYIPEMGPRIADIERQIEGWPGLTSERDTSPPRRPVLDLMEQPHMGDAAALEGAAAADAGVGGRPAPALRFMQG